jgi:hypothetical protein
MGRFRAPNAVDNRLMVTPRRCHLPSVVRGRIRMSRGYGAQVARKLEKQTGSVNLGETRWPKLRGHKPSRPDESTVDDMCETTVRCRAGRRDPAVSQPAAVRLQVGEAGCWPR